MHQAGTTTIFLKGGNDFQGHESSNSFFVPFYM